MSDVTVLSQGGIQQAADIVSIATAAGLELAAAATMLIKESGGGRNVWGHDDVIVAPDTYVKGGPVTEVDYTAYAAAVKAGRAGRQGCGPTQLTFGPFQQRADDLGGCWRFEINCRVGFDILADHIRTRGVQDGFRAYNGTGPHAEAYGRDAKAKYDVWKARLEGDDVPTADEIAAAVWRHTIRNGFGDTVQAQQILVAEEMRTADTQQLLAALAEQIAQLQRRSIMAGQNVSLRELDDVGLPSTMPAVLRLGKSDGLTKVNLGVDFKKNDGPPDKKGKHVDFTLAEIENDLVVPGYADLRTDVGAVRLTAYVGAATTPNSTHSRTEYRELKENGVDKASWSSTSGRHYVWCRGAIIRLAPGRPHMVIAQIHDADDVATIRVEGANVVSTFGNKGRPGTLTTSLVPGQIHEWMIETIRSGSSTIIRYYWDDMTAPKATQKYGGGSGNYFKFGNYHQSSTERDTKGEPFVLDLYDSEVWHTGYPEPAARHEASPGEPVVPVVPVVPGSHGVPVGATQTFFEGFESGDFSRWTSAQTHSTGSHPASSYDPNKGYSLRIVDAGPDHPHVLRTEVRDGDIVVGNDERAELSAFGKEWDARKPGADELWYECDFRLGDPHWTTPQAWTIIMQWHQDHADGSPPLALSVHSDDTVYFEMEADGRIQEPIPVWTVRPGEWEHVVVHVKWSPEDDEGFVEAFVNGVQTVPRTFRQTMYSSDRRNFLKIGCYRRRSNTATAVVMHDNLRVSGPPATSHP